jgi:hypothetical protein
MAAKTTTRSLPARIPKVVPGSSKWHQTGPRQPLAQKWFQEAPKAPKQSPASPQPKSDFRTLLMAQKSFPAGPKPKRGSRIPNPIKTVPASRHTLGKQLDTTAAIPIAPQMQYTTQRALLQHTLDTQIDTMPPPRETNYDLHLQSFPTRQTH